MTNLIITQIQIGTDKDKNLTKDVYEKYTWHVLPQYQVIRQPEHFLRFPDAKHPSHLTTAEVLFGIQT